MATGNAGGTIGEIGPLKLSCVTGGPGCLNLWEGGPEVGTVRIGLCMVASEEGLRISGTLDVPLAWNFSFRSQSQANPLAIVN